MNAATRHKKSLPHRYGTCLYCRRGPRWLQARMLCLTCWLDRTVRALYPPLPKSGNRTPRRGGRGRPDRDALLRAARLDDLTCRARAGEELFDTNGRRDGRGRKS